MASKKPAASSSTFNPNGSDIADAKSLDRASPMAGSMAEQDTLAALRAV